MVHSQHGYQINEFIEMNLSRVTDMKKPTAYATLDRLAANGYVKTHAEQAGNRPVRKVYSITPKGVQYFFVLLKDGLALADSMQFTSDIALMFLDHLAPEDVVPLLQERRGRIAKTIETYEKAPAHGFGVGVDLAIDHQLLHLKSDYQWLGAVIEKLQRGDTPVQTTTD